MRRRRLSPRRKVSGSIQAEVHTVSLLRGRMPKWSKIEVAATIPSGSISRIGSDSLESLCLIIGFPMISPKGIGREFPKVCSYGSRVRPRSVPRVCLDLERRGVELHAPIKDD